MNPESTYSEIHGSNLLNVKFEARANFIPLVKGGSNKNNESFDWMTNVELNEKRIPEMRHYDPSETFYSKV